MVAALWAMIVLTRAVGAGQQGSASQQTQPSFRGGYNRATDCTTDHEKARRADARGRRLRRQGGRDLVGSAMLKVERK
jgi:hypothetical protein